jgi:hypothetical protein
VILSDIRPIQLKSEALRSINTFLDEFLWNILSTARSLVTDRIKAGVLKILPTSLGKAALLEAEVELKAYWERTAPNVGADDTLDFPLQWSYEVSPMPPHFFVPVTLTRHLSLPLIAATAQMRSVFDPQ